MSRSSPRVPRASLTGAVLLLAAVSACAFEPPEPGFAFDASRPDATLPRDAGTDAGAELDTGVLDTGTADTGLLDTGPSDTGPSDTGPSDTGPSDTGPSDSASDAGESDAGVDAAVDSGAPDSGVPIDAGPSSFPYTPSNFDPFALPAVSVDITITGACTLDVGTRLVTGACGNLSSATLTTINQGGSIPTALLTVGALRIDASAHLAIRGATPVIIAAKRDVTILGVLDVDASGTRSGAGGNLAGCAGAGVSGGSNLGNGAGGGGGAFGGPGGDGGDGDLSGTDPGPGGTPFGTDTLVPLSGGCRGGDGGSSGGQSGAAGGGLQVSAAGALSISGHVSAAGGGGMGGGIGDGGGGGGSGGGLLFEASDVTIDPMATITAHGSGGGEGGSGSLLGNSGEDGAPGTSRGPAPGGSARTDSGGDGGDGATAADSAEDGDDGSSASPGAGGGGGGGGGVGRIRVNTHGACSVSNGALISPAPTSNAPMACGL